MNRFSSLVTVHDAHRSGRAHEAAGQLAELARLPLTVLHVATSDTRVRRDPMGAPVRHTTLHVGDVGAQVVDQIGAGDGTLVVIEAFGGGPPGDRLYDTVAERVLDDARHPVVVFGPRAGGWRGPTTLLAAVDGSNSSNVLVPVLERWTDTFGGHIVIVAVGAPDPWPDDGTEPTTDPARTIAEVLQRDGRSVALERVATTAPASALTELAAGTRDSVLVVAAPRSPGRNHWFATARRLIRGAGCPVMVVPADDTADSSQ